MEEMPLSVPGPSTPVKSASHCLLKISNSLCQTRAHQPFENQPPAWKSVECIIFDCIQPLVDVVTVVGALPYISPHLNLLKIDKT